jgi:hypothetical protein
MPKKSPPPKKTKEVLQTRKTVRWQICTKIAQALYYSEIFDAELKTKLNEIIDGNYYVGK